MAASKTNKNGKRSATRDCATCGKPFEYPLGTPGQPPKHCPEHRRDDRGQVYDKRAQMDRKNAKRRRQTIEDAWGEDGETKIHQAAMRLAWYMGRYPSIDVASKAANLRIPPGELDQVAEVARQYYSDYSENDPLKLAQFCADAIFDMACVLRERQREMPPSIAGNAARAMAAVREGIVGSNATNDFAEVTVVINTGEEDDANKGPTE